MQVRVIKTKAGQSLIEWNEDNNMHRAWVPHEDVKHGEIETPERGLPYGDEIELTDLPKAAAIVQALHNAGLWTWEDIRVNPSAVQSAVTQVYDSVISQLLMHKE